MCHACEGRGAAEEGKFLAIVAPLMIGFCRTVYVAVPSTPVRQDRVRVSERADQPLQGSALVRSPVGARAVRLGVAGVSARRVAGPCAYYSNSATLLDGLIDSLYRLATGA